MTAASDAFPVTPRAALDAARVVFASPESATARTLWSAAQQVLQRVVGRPELTGQALVGEVRQRGLITLSDAHALIALATWADRADGAATNEAERLIVREAWMALDHAVPEAAPHATMPPPVAASPYAPPPAGTPSPYTANPSVFSPPPPLTPPRANPAGSDSEAAPEAEAGRPAVAPHRRRFFLALGALLALGLAAAGGVAWWFAGRAERALAAGIEAYQRGSREVARVAFAEAAQRDPDDARPLVYLGRLMREEGDLPRARRFLTNAVRLAPGSAIAARELASLMLADGQPELARRFYVRALEIDPNDRTAQGFLACALFRLQRFDEARRWADRAGPGDWQQCVPPLPLRPPVPVGPPTAYPPPPA